MQGSVPSSPNAINRPDALRRIALFAQPRVVATLHFWARRGNINAYLDTRKVTFENIGRFFGSFEPGDLLDTMDELFEGLVNGVRAYPLDCPGTAYIAMDLQKLEEIFEMELQKRKVVESVDLMDGLTQIKDDEGNRLSDREILDSIVSLVVGAYTSTALVSMWAIHFFPKYPNVLHKLRVGTGLSAKSKTRGWG